MKRKLLITCLLVFQLATVGYCQGIRFIESISIENALSLAQQSGKNVFIDTYASWCIPCKKMEIEFRNKEVANFFNANYVNVRIDMDNSVYAMDYRKEYDIVFLPTMIILDPEGRVKYKTDKVMGGRALQDIATKAMIPEIYFESDASKVLSSPVVQKGQERSVPTHSNSDRERIVHVVGTAHSQSPEYYYEEAYFRIELMDGSHKPAARKYLASQEDWSTPKNLRFISDFLYTTQSPEFDYFSKNIAMFRSELGDLNVDITLDVLIHDRLYNGYPRPTFEEVLQLYQLKDSIFYEQLAFQYFLPRLINECKYAAYNELAQTYVDRFQPQDPNIYYSMSEYCLTSEQLEKQELDYCIKNVKDAIKIKQHLPLYYERLARLYLLNGNKRLAKKAAKTGRNLAIEQKKSHLSFDQLITQINNK